jgi:hypothetical protein
MNNLASPKVVVNPVTILERRGYRNFRKNRCDCPCQQDHRQHLTCAFTNETYFCHRCHLGGSIVALARQMGYRVPAQPPPTAEELERIKFRSWLDRRMAELADEERNAWSRYRSLGRHDWDFLAWFFARQKVWDEFWELAGCNSGREELFEQWRMRHHVAA